MVHAPSSTRKTNGTTTTTNNNTTNHNFETELSENIESQLPVPPDGGWGWMVVFGSFMIHIITDGMTYSFGLFYDEFLTYFNEGKGYTAWIVSIMVGVTFASGPISSSFVNRYGCRMVTIAGSILASFCIVISMFAQNVLTLIITIGLGTGLGFGLIYLPAIVSVSTYFEAKRSLATGIAVCGSGFGTFVFAPLTEHLIGSFGWRGALLIIGGIVLNCIIFGAMFRPLQLPKPKNKKKIIDGHTTSAELEPLKPNIKQADQYLQLPKTDLNGADPLCRSNSVGHNHISLGSNANGFNGSANGKMEIAIVSKSTSNDNIMLSLSQPYLTQSRALHKDKSGSGTMYRQDILYQGSLHNIPEYARSHTDLSGSGHVQRYGSVKHSSLHLNEEQELKKCCGCIPCSKETRDTMAEMLNFALLKDIIFIIFAVSNFCTSIGFNMPYVYIVAQAKVLDLTSEQSSYLIAIIGVANTIGRIILGYISDKTWVNRLWVYNVCLTICGIATAMCPLCKDFYSLGFYCSVFGFTIGAYVGLTSVILVDLLGLEKLTNAFGILLLFQGIASLIGPPIGGWLYDITLSYSPAFILAGIMIAISGLVMFAVPPIQRVRAKKAKQLNAQEIALS